MKWLSNLFENKEQRNERLDNDKYLKLNTKATALVDIFLESKSKIQITQSLNDIGDLLNSLSKDFLDNLNQANIEELGSFKQYDLIMNNTLSSILEHMSETKEIHEWYSCDTFYSKLCEMEINLSKYLFTKYQIPIDKISIDIASNGYAKNYQISYPDQDVCRNIDSLRVILMLMRPFERSHQFWVSNPYTIYPKSLHNLTSFSTYPGWSSFPAPNPADIASVFYVDLSTAEKIVKMFLVEKEKPKQHGVSFVSWLEKEWTNNRKNNKAASFRQWLIDWQ